jgi:hypothetical protein
MVVKTAYIDYTNNSYSLKYSTTSLPWVVLENGSSTLSFNNYGYVFYTNDNNDLMITVGIYRSNLHSVVRATFRITFDGDLIDTVTQVSVIENDDSIPINKMHDMGECIMSAKYPSITMLNYVYTAIVSKGIPYIVDATPGGFLNRSSGDLVDNIYTLHKQDRMYSMYRQIVEFDLMPVDNIRAIALYPVIENGDSYIQWYMELNTPLPVDGNQIRNLGLGTLWSRMIGD